MTFIRLNYNSKDNIYSIPTKMDGTTFKFPDNHPAVKHLTIINPPATYRLLPGYNEPIFALSRTYSPFRTGVYDYNTSYYIHSGGSLPTNTFPPRNPEQEEE